MVVPKGTKCCGVPLGPFYDLSPQIRCTSWMSFVIMVTLFACTVQRLVSSRRPTRYASEASCSAIIAPLWNLMFILPRSWASSLTSHWNGSFLMSNSVDFWYLLISRRATVPGWYLRVFFLVDFCEAGNVFTLPFALPFFFRVLGCSCLCGALPLPGSFGWHWNQSSSSLSGSGGGLFTYCVAFWWFTSRA